MERELNARESINSMIGIGVAFIFVATDTWCGLLISLVVLIVVCIYQYSCMHDGKTENEDEDCNGNGTIQD